MNITAKNKRTTHTFLPRAEPATARFPVSNLYSLRISLFSPDNVLQENRLVMGIQDVLTTSITTYF